jgi:hypothetical protein
MADELGQKQQRASVGGGVQGRTGGPVLTSGGAAPSSPAVRPPHRGSLLTTEIWTDRVWRWWDLLASSSSRPRLVRSAPRLLRSGSPSAAPRRASLNRQRRVPRHRRRHNTAAAMTPLLPPFPNTVPWQAGTTSSVAVASPT